MADARSEEERLPWLDSPRQPRPGAAPRRKLPRGPIYALLALFFIASVGVMAFLAGRGSVPVAPLEAPRAPAPPPAATVTLPPPTVAAPAPAPVVEQARPTPARRATRPRRTAVRRKVANREITPSALEATRQAQEGAASPPPVVRPVVRPVAPPPAQLVRATPVVQLGTYSSRARAEAAHRRLGRVYPYIKGLPKTVRPIQPRGSRRIFYRLQYREYSPDYARVLCRNLRAIGRGCVVLPAGR